MEGVNPQNFIMRGKEMCSLGKESFLERTPPFMGDILWEHLDILQKGNKLYQIISNQLFQLCYIFIMMISTIDYLMTE